MSLADDFKRAREDGTVSCETCVFFHALPDHPAGHSGTCNLNPPQVVSNEDELHYVFPVVASEWYCGHFSRNDTTP